MNQSKMDTHSIAYIGFFLALLIVGGFVIYQVAAVTGMPGVKYVIMGTYVSCLMYILLMKVKLKYTLLLFTTVFALIMSMFNLYMGFAIILTGGLAEGFGNLLFKSYRKVGKSILFAMFTPISALTISKYLIGGIYLQVSVQWILLAGIMGLIFGSIGTYLGVKLAKYLRL